MTEKAVNYLVHCNDVGSLLFLKWYFIKMVSRLTQLVTVFFQDSSTWTKRPLVSLLGPHFKCCSA